MTVGGLEYYYQTNSIGSIVALTDSTGVVVERYEYTAFGTPTFLKPDGTVKAVKKSDYGNEYLFQGRRYDSETGLYYYRARYYDSGKGRFLSRDPLSYQAGMNLYQTFGGNPVNFVDPWGEKPLQAEREKMLRRTADFFKAYGKKIAGSDFLLAYYLDMIGSDLKSMIDAKKVACGNNPLAYGAIAPGWKLLVGGWKFTSGYTGKMKEYLILQEDLFAGENACPIHGPKNSPSAYIKLFSTITHESFHINFFPWKW